jgi:hypothetical protein
VAFEAAAERYADGGAGGVDQQMRAFGTAVCAALRGGSGATGGSGAFAAVQWEKQQAAAEGAMIAAGAATGFATRAGCSRSKARIAAASAAGGGAVTATVVADIGAGAVATRTVWRQARAIRAGGDDGAAAAAFAAAGKDAAQAAQAIAKEAATAAGGQRGGAAAAAAGAAVASHAAALGGLTGLELVAASAAAAAAYEVNAALSEPSPAGTAVDPRNERVAAAAAERRS